MDPIRAEASVRVLEPDPEPSLSCSFIIHAFKRTLIFFFLYLVFVLEQRFKFATRIFFFNHLVQRKIPRFFAFCLTVDAPAAQRLSGQEKGTFQNLPSRKKIYTKSF